MKHWLIQSSGLRRTDDVTDRLIGGLKKVGAKFTDFGVIPFTSEITNWENFPDQEFFLHCSTKILRIFGDEKILPTEIFVGAPETVAKDLYDRVKSGLFYDVQNFNMANYMNKLEPRHLLNGHGEIMTLRELVYSKWNTDKFVKPGKDLKMFTGGMLPAGTVFREYINEMQVDSTFDENSDELMIVADPVQILAEWRFFVIGDHAEIAAQSQYRKHGKLEYNSHVPDFVLEAAKKMAHMYKPAKCFTMDLALTNNLELKVIEYNCINCSGLYHADIGTLAWALRKI